MLPRELETLLNDATDELSIVLDNTEIAGEELSIQISIRDFEKYQRWHIKALRPLNYEFNIGYVDDIRFEENHPRLWDYTEEHCSLYFNGSSLDPNALSVRLVQVHHDLVGPDISLTSYVKCRAGHVVELCQAGHGLFAEGPVRVMSQYAECLREAGVGFSYVGKRPALVWSERGWQPLELKPMMLSLGPNWVIGTEFKWKKDED